MDLRIYYQKVRDLEATIKDEFPIVISLNRADGGKAGTRAEATRRLAAKLVADGLVRLGNADEAKRYREETEEARRQAEQQAAATRLQLTVLSTTDLERLKAKVQPGAKG